MYYLDNMIQYTNIMNGDKNNFLAEYLNYDLIKDLKDFTMKTTVFNSFSEKYNLRYFGELIERFEERKVVEDVKDLRTLVLIASATIYKKPNYYNTNQAEVFARNVTKKLRDEFDLISATFLLAFTDNQLTDDDREFLLNNIFECVKENKNISFEQRVLSCFSVLYCNEDTIRKEYKERVAELFFNGTMAPQELQHQEDCTTYMMLSRMISNLNIAKSSKSFKDKSLFKFYKALLSLSKKEQKIDKMESIIKDLKDMDYSYILYYNYKLSSEDFFIKVNSSVTSKGYIRLANQMLSFLEKDELCSKNILDIIKDGINDHSYKYRNEASSREKAVDDFFTEYKGKISRVNFDNFLSLTNINNNNFTYNFLGNESLRFLLEDENKDLLDKLNTKHKKNLIEGTILHSKDNEEIKDIFDRFINTESYILKIKDLNSGVIIKLLELNILDSNSDKLLTTSKTLECVLKFWSDKLISKDFIEKLKYAYNYFKDDKALDSKDFFNLNKNLRELISEVYYTLSTYKIEEIEDDCVASEFYKLLDELSLHVLSDRLKYYRYINENLSNEHYLRVLNISEYDKRMICKSMYDNVNEYIRKENEKYSYERYHVGYSKKFVNSIEEIALTLEEKNEIFLEKQRLREEKLLKEAKECEYLSEFDGLIANIKNENSLNLMKDLFLEKMSKEEFIMSSKPLRAFKILKIFDKAGILKDEDILLVSKKVIETQYN